MRACLHARECAGQREKKSRQIVDLGAIARLDDVDDDDDDHDDNDDDDDDDHIDNDQ